MAQTVKTEIKESLLRRSQKRTPGYISPVELQRVEVKHILPQNA